MQLESVAGYRWNRWPNRVECARKTLAKKGVAAIEDLRAACIEAEVRLVACQMTVDLFDWDPADFVPEVSEWVGAASFLPRALQADVNLFV